MTTHAGQSPTAELRPPVFGWRLLSDLSPANGSQFQVGIVPPDAQGTLRIRGSVGNEVGVATAKMPVADPPLFFGNAFRAALERAGVSVAGSVRRAAPDEALDAKARTIYTRRSPCSRAAAVRQGERQHDRRAPAQVLRRARASASAPTSTAPSSVAALGGKPRVDGPT